MLIQVGNRFNNLGMMTDAAYSQASKGKDAKLTINLATVQPASVGASDWSTKARDVVIVGYEATTVARLLSKLSEERINAFEARIPEGSA